jgi:PTH1 family peptidyl-tRNA hydrolase
VLPLKAASNVKLFVGLGNPGPEYKETRHNVGVWWLDRLAHFLNVSFSEESNWRLLLAKAEYEGQRIFLARPLTYMNESGHPVRALTSYYRINPKDMVIAHDELDLSPGTIKLKMNGGHAGHNGLKSVIAHLGTSDFWRLRIGIGHPGHKDKVVSWVLGKPAEKDRLLIEDAIECSGVFFPELLRGDMNQFMQHLHTS